MSEQSPPQQFFDLFWHKFLRRPYRLHIYDHGGQGPVILLLHGLASSSANWGPLIPLLQQKYRCISIDLVGFGTSPKPQWYDYTIEQHIRDIRYTVQRLRPAQPFMLVGHSLGSLLAMRYAKTYPGQINRLILLSPPVYAPLDSISSRAAKQRTSLYLRAYRFIRTNKRVSPENIIRLTKIIPFLKFLVLDPASWIPFVRSLEQCIEHQTIIDDITAVNAPIDIFYGIFDEVVVPYNVKRLASLKDVTLHPLKVSHLVGKRYAEAVAKLLLPEEKPSPKKLRPRFAVKRHKRYNKGDNR